MTFFGCSFETALLGTLLVHFSAFGVHFRVLVESFPGPWEVWIWSHFSSGFWGGAWWAQKSWTPGPAKVKVAFQAHLTAVQEGYRTN